MTEQNKERTPMVSVIIPTYNRVHTLPASIGSVLSQTYTNLEVIIVDDGSTDETESFVRGLTDDRVHYVKNTGKCGPAAARNLGARLAAGEYLAFQDSDDEWCRNKLEKQMSLLHSTKGEVDLVYCEYTRYYGCTGYETVPSRNLSSEFKQGNILPVLLLQPMIGTPTIVVRRECFEKVGGFNEILDTFEDYEFTVRFSQNHKIAFVAESLVKVNDSPNSVDKRFAGRIRTQMYIVREMITSLREHNLLWEKLSAVQKTAEHLKCHDIFLEELWKMNEFFITEEEKRNAAYLIEKTERSDAKQNQRRELAQEALSHAKRRLIEVYVDIYGDIPVETAVMDQVLHQVKDCVRECEKRFDILIKQRNAYDMVMDQEHQRVIFGTRLERLSALADVVTAVEELEKIIYQQRVECNVCNNSFFRNRSLRCPYCDADAAERLMIAFLQELQPEEDEKLMVRQMVPSKRVESYLLGRHDVQADCFTQEIGSAQILQGEEGKYDILLCSAQGLRADNIDETLRNWSRLMKSSGICLIVPSSDNEGQSNINGTTVSEFYVSEVGEKWFGTEFFKMCGIDSRMALKVLTKEKPLSEM